MKSTDSRSSETETVCCVSNANTNANHKDKDDNSDNNSDNNSGRSLNSDCDGTCDILCVRHKGRLAQMHDILCLERHQ